MNGKSGPWPALFTFIPLSCPQHRLSGPLRHSSKTSGSEMRAEMP